MTFFLRSGWYVQFTEPDLRTPLPRRFTFQNPEKIRELARRVRRWEPRMRGMSLSGGLKTVVVAFIWT
jgi:hypothetical protein